MEGGDARDGDVPAVMRRFVFACGVTLVALALAEAATRTLDGYVVASPRLIRRSLAPPDSIASAFVSRFRTPVGVDRAWYALDPPTTRRTADPDLNTRYWSHEGHELPSVYEW